MKILHMGSRGSFYRSSQRVTVAMAVTMTLRKLPCKNVWCCRLEYKIQMLGKVASLIALCCVGVEVKVGVFQLVSTTHRIHTALQCAARLTMCRMMYNFRRRRLNLIPPYQNLPPLERLASRKPIRHYMGVDDDTPFTRVIIQALNMLLHVTLIGNAEGFRLVASKVMEAAQGEGC